MALASGINEQFIYVAETGTRGTTPATPAFRRLLLDGRAVQGTKELLTSPSVINNGQAGSSRHGFKQVAGTTPFTLRYDNFDDLFELHLGGTWAAGVAPSAQGDLVVATATTITSAGATFLTDGYEVGDVVQLANFDDAENNIKAVLVGVAAGTLTFGSDISLTTAAADANATVAVIGQKLKVGTTLRSWTVERGFVDAAPLYFGNTGVTTSSLGMTIGTGANVTCDASWVGMDFADVLTTSMVADLSGSLDAITERDPIASIDTISRLYLGATKIGTATGVSFTMARPRGVTPVVFANSSPDVFDADLAVTGAVNLLLDSAEAEYTKFYNELPAVIHCLMYDKDAVNFVKVTISNGVYSGADIQSVQGAGAVPQNMPFVANRDSTSSSNITMQIGNV